MDGDDLDGAGRRDSEEWGRCVCGVASTRKRPGDDEEDTVGSAEVQIECDICHVWFHASCVGLGPVQTLTIDKYHCAKCANLCGPSIFKPVTNSHRFNRTEGKSTDSQFL